MTEYRTDEEQAEIIKKWWSENGTSLLATIAVAAAGVFGWNFWQDHKQAEGEAASAIYSQMLELAAQQQNTDNVQIQNLAEQLQNDFAGSSYADFAGLFIARIAAENGDYEAAAAELTTLAAATDQEPVRYLAQARLAKALVQLDKTQEALDVLPAEPNAAFAPQIEEARGDALYRQGDLADARQAYLKAMEAARALGQMNPALQEKIDSLAVAAAEDA
ncbi:MAG: GTP-binding protein [Oceanospirillaceae bacterium]|nr:GTP-binding protein [Oceanospirillaceae bacterium]|tara:strand:+ start:13970 stop:14626 length:657 start_codon:yes stop_codon:yes gene_type:complete